MSEAAGSVTADMREDEVEGPRHAGQVERLHEHPAVVDLAPAVGAQEAPELALDRDAALSRLPLEDAKRSQLALGGDDLLDGRDAERADELVLEVLDAGVEAEALHGRPGEIGAEAGPFQAPLDGPLLARVVEARQPDVEPPRPEPLEEPADGLGAADGLDGDALGGEIAAAPGRERLERVPIALPFDEDYGPHARSRILPHPGSFAPRGDPA